MFPSYNPPPLNIGYTKNTNQIPEICCEFVCTWNKELEEGQLRTENEWTNAVQDNIDDDVVKQQNTNRKPFKTETPLTLGPSLTHH